MVEIRSRAFALAVSLLVPGLGALYAGKELAGVCILVAFVSVWGVALGLSSAGNLWLHSLGAVVWVAWLMGYAIQAAYAYDAARQFNENADLGG